jgi:hypothetical protein
MTVFAEVGGTKAKLALPSRHMAPVAADHIVVDLFAGARRISLRSGAGPGFTVVAAVEREPPAGTCM